jgi:hypothetical protein
MMDFIIKLKVFRVVTPLVSSNSSSSAKIDKTRFLLSGKSNYLVSIHFYVRTKIHFKYLIYITLYTIFITKYEFKFI